MRKPLLWLTFIAQLMSVPSYAGMLGSTPAPKPAAEPKAQQKSQTTPAKSSQPVRAEAAKRAVTEKSAAMQDQLEKETVEYLQAEGYSAKDAKEFLEKTKNMSPQELQAYMASLKRGLEEGTIQPNDVDESISKDIRPYDRSARKKPSQRTIQQQQNQEAFEGMMSEILPLSPEQIEQVQKYYDLSLQAKATPPTPPPTPSSLSLPVNLEPGSQSPVIRLAAGFVSTLLFIDRTGAPWPITAYSLGDPKNFNIQWDSQSNTMFIQSTKKYVHANMAVRLVGLNTPVMLTLVSGQKQVDFRVDLQLQARGPEAFPAAVEVSPYSSQVNAEMINVLDGVPPKGSLKLTVNGGPGQAWLFNNKIYYRSKLTLLSPAWLATVSSPDGTHVYEIMPTPYLLASKDGQTMNIKLTGL